MRRAVAAVIWAIALATVVAPSAAASCAPFTPRQSYRGADLVFVGGAEPSGDTGFTDFEVEAYFKGAGPDVVHVLTGQPHANVGGSGDLHPRAGSRWVVYASTSPEFGLRTHACSGSHAIPIDGPLPSLQRLGAPPSAATAAPYVPLRSDGEVLPIVLAGLVGVVAGVAFGAIVLPRLLVRRAGARRPTPRHGR